VLVFVMMAPAAALAEATTPANLPARPVVVETSLPTHKDHVPQCAFDGKVETYFRSARACKADDTLTLAFEKPVRAGRVEVLTGTPDGKDALAAAVLETSADGTTFAPAATFKGGAARADLGNRPVKALRIRATGDAAALVVREITLESLPAIPTFRYPVEIVLDDSQVPEMKDWCRRAKETAEAWYPVLAQALRIEGYAPPRRVNLTFKKGMDGIAGTSGGNIFCADGWFKAHPDDVGAIIHEVIHVIQSYPKYDPPWLVEGIADYVRFWVFEPNTPRRPLNPARIRYQDSYQVTGAFLAWAVKTYDKDLVLKLNEARHKAEYNVGLFKQCTGKDLDTLWEEFRASLRK
jgi:hypothetical protein